MTRESAAGRLRVYCSDFFEVDKEILESYGAFNVSLVNGLPLFVDPFLLLDSKNAVYQGAFTSKSSTTSSSCATCPPSALSLKSISTSGFASRKSSRIG